MRDDIIQREIPPIDERLPYAEFIAEAQQQAAETPIEIIENGYIYEAFDYKAKIVGHMNGGILFYRKVRKAPVEGGK